MWYNAPISGMPYLQHLEIGREWIGAILTKYQPLGKILMVNLHSFSNITK